MNDSANMEVSTRYFQKLNKDIGSEKEPYLMTLSLPSRKEEVLEQWLPHTSKKRFLKPQWSRSK